MKRIGWVSSAWLFCALTAVPVMNASIFGTDVPGDGVSVCSQPGVTCDSNFIGTASGVGGLLTGILQKGGSTLGLQLGSQPEFINFAGGTENVSGFHFVGPLGFNTQYASIGGNNV